MRGNFKTRGTEISSELVLLVIISVFVFLLEERGHTGCSSTLGNLEKQSYSLRITVNESSGCNLNALDI